MAEQKPNTECKICGKIYYSCRTCGEVNHWKAVACCPQHYAEYVNKVLEERCKENKIVVKPTTIENEKVVVEATKVIVEKSDVRKKISEKTL